MVADRCPGNFIAQMTASLVPGEASAGGFSLPAGAASVSDALTAAEILYADLVDDGGVVAAISAGPINDFQGKDTAWWRQRYSRQRSELTAKLMAIPERGLSAEDARAVRIMRAKLNSGLPDNPLEAAYGEAPSPDAAPTPSTRTSAPRRAAGS